jgi:hypothetical protein
MAIAVDLESDFKCEFVVDMSPSWTGRSFQITCTLCRFKQNNLSYYDLPEPYHCLYVDYKKLWAYNWKHLDLIYKFLSGEKTENHLYEFYITFIHGAWKKKKYINAIENHIAEIDKLHNFASAYVAQRKLLPIVLKKS